MWLATCEDEHGMWWDDPIGADTAEECRKIALEKWSRVPEGVAVVLWQCSNRGEIDRPVRQRAEGLAELVLKDAAQPVK